MKTGQNHRPPAHDGALALAPSDGYTQNDSPGTLQKVEWSLGMLLSEALRRVSGVDSTSG